MAFPAEQGEWEARRVGDRRSGISANQRPSAVKNLGGLCVPLQRTIPAEELDFILNYDIQYCLGHDPGEED